jgi:ABC-2 type transport system ATP-binding protein
VIYSTHQIEEASHYGDRLVVLADGETIFDGSFDQLRREAGPRPEGAEADPENDFVRFLRQRGH